VHVSGNFSPTSNRRVPGGRLPRRLKKGSIQLVEHIRRCLSSLFQPLRADVKGDVSLYMNRDIELLIIRASRLVFGVFGQMINHDDERVVRVGGSGIFIAPFQTLTARHVNRDLFRIDPMREDNLNRRVRAAELNARTDYFDLQHSAVLFQARFGRNPRGLLWHVRRVWDSNITDISLFEVYAEGDEAGGMENEMRGFFEWSLLPPPVGSHVLMLGYPQTNIRTDGDLLNINLTYVLQDGYVTDIYELSRDRGMFPFPCFRIDQPVDHGFSGGPVFWEDKLCGIVCGGDLDNGTVAASLWPLCMLEYQYPDLGILGEQRVFSSLFESGVLRSRDWPRIRERIEKRYDDNGMPYAYIAPVETI